MNKTLGLVLNVGLLAMLVGFAPAAYGQDSSKPDRAANPDKKFYDKLYVQENKASMVDEIFYDEDRIAEEKAKASAANSTSTFSDVGNETTRHIDRMVAILGEMEETLGTAARTAALRQNSSNVASEPRTEQPALRRERATQESATDQQLIPTIEQQAKPQSPMMEEEMETTPEMGQATVPDDIIGMPRLEGRIPERLAQPPMTNLPTEPSESLSTPPDMTEPSDMEDRPMPVVPNEVPPRIIEDESMLPQPPPSVETDMDSADKPDQPEDSEDMMTEPQGSLDVDGNYIPPER